MAAPPEKPEGERPNGRGEVEDGGLAPPDHSPTIGPSPWAAAEAGFRCGYVAVVGRPNVGKSTLINRLLAERLCIVTPKPQTTRRRTLGILNREDVQAILIDTPGLMEPRYGLHHAMLRETRLALADADLILLMAEPQDRVEVPPAIRERAVPRVLALNKIDLWPQKDKLLPTLEAWHATGLVDELIPISALQGDGIDALRVSLLLRLPESPPLYPPDQLAEQPERFFVGEIIRERIFVRFEDEVPYASEVLVEQFIERHGAKDFIEASVSVEQESQKAILIGKGGAAIRALGEDARRHIEEFLGRPVFLSLRVRVVPKWRRRDDALRRFGYRR